MKWGREWEFDSIPLEKHNWKGFYPWAGAFQFVALCSNPYSGCSLPSTYQSPHHIRTFEWLSMDFSLSKVKPFHVVHHSLPLPRLPLNLVPIAPGLELDSSGDQMIGASGHIAWPQAHAVPPAAGTLLSSLPSVNMLIPLHPSRQSRHSAGRPPLTVRLSSYSFISSWATWSDYFYCIIMKLSVDCHLPSSSTC